MSAVAERLYALRRTLAMAARHPGRFLVSTLLVGAALALPLTAASIALAAATAWNTMTAGPEISVFLRAGTVSRDLETLGARLAAMEGVSGVRAIPRDHALAELSKRSGLSSTSSDGRSNPLPDTLVARFAMTVDPAVIDRTAERVRKWTEVDSVQADLGWYRRLVDLRRAGLSVAASLAVLTSLLAGAAVLGSTVLITRLPPDEVRILQLAGAQPSFVRRPYVYAAAITLAAGVLLAAALAWAAIQAVGPRAALVAPIPPPELLGWAVLVAAGGAGLIGALLGHTFCWAQMKRFRPW